MSLATTTNLGTVNANTSYNMGTVDFTASADALGTWNVYAIQQGGTNYHTFWVDGMLSDFDFGNLPISAGNSSILLGTITVVPEPATLALAGLGVGIALLGARRKRLPRAG